MSGLSKDIWCHEQCFPRIVNHYVRHRTEIKHTWSLTIFCRSRLNSHNIMMLARHALSEQMLGIVFKFPMPDMIRQPVRRMLVRFKAAKGPLAFNIPKLGIGANQLQRSFPNKANVIILNWAVLLWWNNQIILGVRTRSPKYVWRNIQSTRNQGRRSWEIIIMIYCSSDG